MNQFINPIIPNSEPAIGTKHEDATFEYRYGQEWDMPVWIAVPGQKGWGIRLKNPHLSGKIPAPAETINGYPITNMSFLFAYSHAPIIDLSNFNTSNVNSMKWMFAFSLARTLVIRTLDTSNVLDMSFMFHHAHVEFLDVNSFNTSKVLNMDNMFSGLRELTINLSSFDMANVISTSEMFTGSKMITGRARAPEDADKLNASIGKFPALVFLPKAK